MAYSMLTTLKYHMEICHKSYSKALKMVPSNSGDEAIDSMRCDMLTAQSHMEQIVLEILTKVSRSQCARELASTMGWTSTENAELMISPINASTLSSTDTFLNTHTMDLLKQANKRSYLGQGNSLSRNSLMGNAQTAPHSPRQPLLSAPSICPNTYCNKPHGGRCRMACLKCTGSLPPLQRNHSGPCNK